MNELFADYIPDAWFDEQGMTRASLSLGLSATAVKRMRRWKNTAKGLAVSVAVSAAVMGGSVAFAQPAASNELAVPVPPSLVHVAPPPAEGSSLGEVNKSFDALFAAIRSGQALITNERTRTLATKAAAHRNQRPEGWSRKLASDTGEADD